LRLLSAGRWRTLRRLSAGCLLALALGACARSNVYHGLKMLPVEEAGAVARPRNDAAAPRVGIAFGGGGVRGFVHLGVLRALNEAGIDAGVASGSSAGAIAAALYASGMSYPRIEKVIYSLAELDLVDVVASREGLINGQALAAWVREATGYERIESLPRTLGIVVTDLANGRPVVIVEGDLGQAVQASASVPGTMVPVQSRGSTLIDGGVLTVVPVRAARALGADIVIGVDVYCGAAPAPRRNAVDTVFRTFRLQSCLLSEAETREADVLIRPGFEPASATSFGQREQAVEAGYIAAKAQIPALKARLEKPRQDP